MVPKGFTFSECAGEICANTSSLPKSKPPENTYPTWKITRSETRATSDLVTTP